MVFKSPHANIDIPEVSLPEYLLAKIDGLKDKNKAAYIDAASGRTISFAQLKQAAERMAAGLSERGFVKGDVFAMYAPNLPEYAIAFLGIGIAGGTITTVNPLTSAHDLATQLKDSKATYLITIKLLLDKANEAVKDTGVKEIFVFDTADDVTSFSDLIKSKAKTPQVKFNPKVDVLALPYSSGTTGLPKGVMLTHSNLVSNIAQFIGLKTTDDSDIVLSVLPFFHIYGMTVIVNGLMAVGATAVIMPQFELEGYLKAMQQYKVTQTYVAPPLVLLLTKHPLVDNYDLSHLKLVFSGAAPLDAQLSESCAKRLKCIVTQGYGLTEASPGITSSSLTPESNRPGTVGRLLPNTLVRIVDTATGKDGGVDDEGEILAKGPQMMKGYLNNPSETKLILDSEGWLHTGDIGKFDADGFLSVVDRVKELIKYKGFQVAPAELEALLLQHPAVADAAVIPRRDEESGEVPIALVVKKADVKEDQLMEFVSQKVPSYKRIRSVEFIDSIPKSPAGKILRRKLVERERDREALKDKKVVRLHDRVTVEKIGHVMLMGLDRPHKLNAFDMDMFLGLGQAITQMDDDEQIRCGVLFAHGPVFTAGIDLASALPIFAQGKSMFPEDLIDPWGVTGRRERVKPLILAAHGRCWTLGIELALASDIVVAAEDTRFSQMEVCRGIIPFGGATMRFPQVAGWGNAMRYLLTGDEFDVQEAHRIGIVQEIVPKEKLLERAIELATRIAAQAPLAVQATMASARQYFREGFEEAADSLFPAVSDLIQTSDCKEGVRSFMEKRVPVFTGK